MKTKRKYRGLNPGTRTYPPNQWLQQSHINKPFAIMDHHLRLMMIFIYFLFFALECNTLTD